MQDFIITTTREILTKAGFSVEDVIISNDNEVNIMILKVETDDPRLLIGRDGDVIRSVNHIIQRAVERKYGRDSLREQNFLIDVNDYYVKKIQEIKTKARIVSDRARSFKNDIALEPMSAYDRLMVHSFVSNISDVTTESAGEGRDRHVVIKYSE